MPEPTVETKLSILSQCLEKKEGALSQILAITENQSTLLAVENADESIHAIFREMNREKQVLIDTVIACDKVFEKMFSELGEDFAGRAQPYKASVAALQALIRRVMDIDVKIRLQENANKSLSQHTALPQKPIIKGLKADRKTLAREYGKNAKKN